MWSNSKKVPCRSLLILFVSFIYFFGTMQVNGQYQAMVKRITAETANGIRITAWLKRQKVSLEQNTVIYYMVENRGNKVIYLVRKKGEIETATTADGNLVILVPLPFPEGHGEYNYGFTRVKPGEKYQGQLTFPGNKYNEARKWSIDVSFGLVRNIKGLDRKPRPDEDIAPLRGLLGERIEVLGLNGLVVEVEK